MKARVCEMGAMAAEDGYEFEASLGRSTFLVVSQCLVQGVGKRRAVLLVQCGRRVHRDKAASIERSQKEVSDSKLPVCWIKSFRKG